LDYEDSDLPHCWVVKLANTPYCLKPVSKFDENVDVKDVNSLENLQPLWAEENLSKYNHYNN
jgi:hypothetical protein